MGSHSSTYFALYMYLSLQNLLSLDHCIGIIGGKPKHSVYFVGFQGKPMIASFPGSPYQGSKVILRALAEERNSGNETTPMTWPASFSDHLS